MDLIKKFIQEERESYELLRKIDQDQKKRGEIMLRYITISFLDQKSFYQIVDETPRKYILHWAVGEMAYPEWGATTSLFKKKVEKAIRSRDWIEDQIEQKKAGQTR